MQAQAQQFSGNYLKSIWFVASCVLLYWGSVGGGSNSLAVCVLALIGVEIRSQYLTQCAYKACTASLIFDIIYLSSIAVTIVNGWWVLTFGSFGIIGKFVMIYFGKKFLEEDLQNGLLGAGGGGGGGGGGEYQEPQLHADDSSQQNPAEYHQQQQQTIPKAIAVVGGYQSAL
jgi:hypothetical protein